jgi:hypothetical protein
MTAPNRLTPDDLRVGRFERRYEGNQFAHGQSERLLYHSHDQQSGKTAVGASCSVSTPPALLPTV